MAMFYGVRARGPHDPSLDQVLDTVREQLNDWRARDARKEELKQIRKKESARYASWKASVTEDVPVGRGKETQEAAQFYKQCKEFDKERLWDRLLNRPSKTRLYVPPPKVAEPPVETEFKLNIADLLPKPKRGASKRKPRTKRRSRKSVRHHARST